MARVAHRRFGGRLPKRDPHRRGGGPSIPVNSVAPVASGTVTIGGTLTTTDGTWSGSPTYAYQWRRAGVNIGGATASTYTPVAADMGPAIDCNVTATNAGGSASADSNDLTYLPTQMTNVRAWYRGDTLTLSGADVTQWTDKTAHANHLTPPGAEPQYTAANASYNNHPTVTGNGTDEYFTKAAFSMGAVVSDYALVVVGHCVSSLASRRILTYNDVPRLFQNGSTPTLMQHTSTNTVANMSTSSQATPALWWATRTVSPGNQRLIRHATAEDTDASGASTIADGLTLSMFATPAGATFANFCAAEALVMRADPTASEIADYAAYCANRYGVS